MTYAWSCLGGNGRAPVNVSKPAVLQLRHKVFNIHPSILEAVGKVRSSFGEVLGCSDDTTACKEDMDIPDNVWFFYLVSRSAPSLKTMASLKSRVASLSGRAAKAPSRAVIARSLSWKRRYALLSRAEWSLVSPGRQHAMYTTPWSWIEDWATIPAFLLFEV